MSRAHADGLHRVALALADYLSRECRADPNPSGHSAPHPRSVADNEPALPATVVPEDEGTPALVRDMEYSVMDAMKITKRAESTLRKLMSTGRLPYRKEGARSVISGEHLAQLLAKQGARSTDPSDED